VEKIKLVNIWQLQQERGCLIHFAHLANTLLKDEESARDYHVLVADLPNIHRFKMSLSDSAINLLYLVVNNGHNSNSRRLESSVLSTTSPGHDKAVHDKQ